MSATTSRRNIHLAWLLLAGLALGCAQATENEAVTAFTQAFAGGDATPKRESLRAVAALPKEMDDIVYRLLVQAVGDRQTHDDAVLALRARSGLQPTIYNKGNGYPGYPNSDEPADWNAWLAARTKDKEQTKQLADQAKQLKDLEDKKKKDAKDKAGGAGCTTDSGKTADNGKPSTADAGTTTESKTSTPEPPPNDLGKPSRIIFKNGGSLVCYVIFKRTDSDGVLQSVRIIHLDGGGEETLAADLIARIEESAR